MTDSNKIGRRAALGTAFAAASSIAAAGAGVAAEKTPAAPKRGGKMRVYEVGNPKGDLDLRMVERPIPTPGPGEVLLKVLATGVNAVDLASMKGIFLTSGGPHKIPLQDNCSHVVALGPGVTTLNIGDRVTTTLYIEWITGPWDVAYMRSMIGLGRDGFLAEYVVMPANTLARVPDHFTNEEACTLAVAGLTSWRALVDEAKIKSGETVVTLGTGGVSSFNVQIAKLFGARVIVTSSSDAKLERMKELGADLFINYRTTPNWAQEVLKLTNGRGADVVLNNVGWPEMENSLRACGSSARLIHIGTGGQRVVMKNWPNMITKSIWIKGFTMAGREMLGGFLSAMEHTSVKPIVDRVFPFEQAIEAIRFMEKSDHIGKVVIKVA